MEREKPDLSIVFPTWKRPDDVEENLKLLKRNISLEYEVFILDNADNPPDFALADNEYYLKMPGNIGCEARNTGVLKARGKYVLMLDDDSHPLPGSVEKAVEILAAAGDDVAGLIADITRPDGTREASLLPTVMQGCGTLFKTACLQAVNGGYPGDLLFYGEEYWLGFLLAKNDLRITYSPELKVCHRTGGARNLERIFYQLARNNRILWDTFVPDKYLQRVIADTECRYKLIAQKENVVKAFQDGLDNELKCRNRTPLTDEQFLSFSLLDKFKHIHKVGKVVLCGTGKFPGLWIEELKNKAEIVYLSDFNPALHGAAFNGIEVLKPEDILPHSDALFVVGHSSHVDTDRWLNFLNKKEHMQICDIQEN